MYFPTKDAGSCLRLFGALCLLSCCLAAQTDVLTDPPDTRGAGGGAGANLESIDPVGGALSLAIPAGRLGPGPGGFTGGMNLIYNSNIYDVQTIAMGAALSSMMYAPSTHGGGWSYGYKFTLWSQPRALGVGVNGLGQNTCSDFGSSEQQDWYKTFLQTPDGANHVLRLVSLVPDGTTSAGESQAARDVGNNYYAFDFLGVPNRVCSPAASIFHGTMVYATVDGTFIRVETNTNVPWSTHMWTAYLPDGTQASGPINYNGVSAADSDSYTITDRNGNALTLVGNCAIGAPCTETIWDGQGRNVTIQYASKAGQTWQDVVTSPGVHGPLITTINWQTFDPGSLQYPCHTNLQAAFLGVCSLQGNLSSVVASVQLPPPAANTNPSAPGNSTIYSFGYSAPSGQRSWGEVHSLTKCAGTTAASCSSSQTLGSSNNQSTTQYSYAYDSSSLGRFVGIPFNPISSRTLSYQELRDGSANQALNETTTYSVPPPTSIYTYPVTGTSTVTGPNGSSTQFLTMNSCSATTLSRDYCAPMLYKVINPDGTTTELAWASNSTPPGLPAGLPVNPYPQYQVTSINGKARGRAISQDVNGNSTWVAEYDWSSGYTPSTTMITGVPGSVLRTTTGTMNASTPYWTHGAPLYLRAKNTSQVGTVTSTYTYDNPLATANLTGLQVTDSATGASISSSWGYLTNGNVSSQTVSGVTTQISYDGSNLYPVKVTAGNIRSTSPVYDFNSGLELNETDDNQVLTQYGYDDLGRQLRVEESNRGLDRVTSTSFDDAGMSVTTTRSLQPGQNLSSTMYLDGLGRVRYSINEAGMKVQKGYRYGTGGISYELESNPYGASSDSSTMGWSLTTRDAMGRVTSVQSYPDASGTNPPGGLNFAGSPAPAAWGSNTGSSGKITRTYNVTAGCTGVGMQVSDEAFNTRTTCMDGLGRVGQVIQADGNSALYTYDLLDNRTSVNFAGQWRRFEYSLGQMTAACNPESVPDGSNGTAAVSCAASPLPQAGVERYTYYANGNVQTYTNARGVSATYQYDGLNRPASTSYNDGTSVTYQYDQDYKGALYSVTTSAGNGTVFGHDGLGRVVSSTQTTLGYTYSAMAYGYALTDQLTSETYPSGRQVTYGLDGAGRVSSVTGVLAGVNSPTYASQLQYAAHGGLTSVNLGSGMTESYSWNDRLQQVGQSTGSLLSLNFYPCTGLATSCSTNNGNIQQQTITVPGMTATQQYGYDNLNRLTVAAENGAANCSTTGGTWCQHFAYDTAGNRRMDQSYGYGGTLWDAGTFSPATNRIADANWRYDDSGNVTKAPVAGLTMGYDAENRQVALCTQGELPCPNQWQAGRTVYVYDGLGQRVGKIDGSGKQTVYVYDAFGNLAAEYAPGGAPADQTQYVTVDNLGSTRLITGSNGTERHDYYPFGVEAGGGWRTTGLGYLADTMRQQFTGAEFDNESTLNFLQARYLSTGQGRFTSVDPGNAGADPGDPQTWNGYAYVGNNPLSYTDPDGLGIFGDIGGIIGSFFPGFGNLIGWGIGSIADLATGQSISPPGFNIGSAIFGSIAGSVNNSQPWNEQLPSGVGSIGGLNTGSVYGSGNVGGMIFSFTDAACNAAYAVDFVKAHIGDAAEVAARLRVPTQNVLGLSAAESRYGLDWNATKVADNGQPAMNFFSLQGNAKSPFANGSVLSGGKTRLSAFPSYKAAAQSFEAQYGGLVTGKVTPVAFATALVPRFNSGKAPLGNPNFIRDLVNTIGMTQRRMGCR